MATKDKVVTVESLKAKHDYDESTYLKINEALTTLGINASVSELNYVDGVTSAIQAQLNGKQATINGGASTITGSNLTTNRALISNGSGKVAVSDVTSTELAYLDGVTSAIQTQLNGKAPIFTSSTGAVEYSFAAGSGVNILTQISSWDVGVHTAYAAEGLSGNPKTTQAWRFLCHKVTTTIGWVIAFGSSGDVYSNYLQDSFKGWRRIYEVAPATLWSHVGQYMAASHTATPSKALSECANGWLLLWSDYDAGDTSQNLDFCTTIIPKKNYAGEAWSGQKWLCTIPYASDSSAGDKILIKTLHIHDDKIVGDALNNVSPRNDVCLRAVFEW